MNQYITTEQENWLFNLPYESNELKVLQTNSISRIQIVSFKGVKALKSIDDHFRKIRIVVASLLIKIFITHNTSNQDRLRTLKKIVYKAKLDSITEQKGILREQLLKSVAEQLRELKVGNSNVELQIIRMFNCTPFFDETLMAAFKQQNPLIIENDCEISSWLDRQMSVKVLWNEEALLEQNEGDLCLIGLGEQFHASKDCKCHDCNYKGFKDYLRFSSQTLFIGDQIITSEVYDRKTREHLFSCPMSPDERFSQLRPPPTNPNLYMSIQSVSPSLKSMHESGKQNKKKYVNSPDGYNSVGLFDSIYAVTDQKLKNSVVSERKIGQQRPTRIRRSNKTGQESSSLWNILCCSIGRQ